VKVYCKRTYFFDDGSIKWKKDCWYEFSKAEGFESNYVYGYIKHDFVDTSGYKESISKSNFNKYFWTQKELRDIRIKEILK
jgi:hypothetical protein